MERRLAAILAADVVGYSCLMEDGEAGTLRRLTELRDKVLEPLITEHHGRIVKLMGDGFLVEFASAVDSVACAIAWQDSVSKHEAHSETDTTLQFRIGINLGDVIAEGGDIYGAGVNVAARLERLAQPGGICVSDDVYRHAKGKIEGSFEDIGRQTLKNLADPVRIYRYLGKPNAMRATTLAASHLPLPNNPSIAVLSFTNLSKDTEKDFLADGISEDIITSLSQLRWLFVIARNSSFAYKGKPVDVRQVGRELGVRYVMEGSIRTDGARVRVSAQLSDAISGKQLWAERYDRQQADIFLLQDEITETIVAAIQPELSTAEQDRARRKPPDNLDAWEAYQRGLWHLYHFTNEHFDEALKLFSRACDLDPNFAPSQAGKAYVHIQRSFYADPAKRAETLNEALHAARIAVNLDEKDASAHFSLGRAHCLRCEFEPGIDELRTALVLNPSYAQAHFGLGHALAHTGQMENAISTLDSAIRLSPHDPHLFAFYAVQALAYFYLDRFDEAVGCASKAVRAPYATFWPHLAYTAALAKSGQLTNAKAACAELLRLKPGYTTAATREDFFFTRDAGIVQKTIDALRIAGLPD